ncbi:kinesin-like protein KIN-14B isoform X2 [Magnolia sinica]|uniref:kinesin-like protein KIN-14B isoform X2 n=1 Tax=Magnolia sinica TaxID=86752 RepID=UPI0026590E2C|nr:kinesin-like protein KIN-14B isoform X2 [Magnolia sinica]
MDKPFEERRSRKPVQRLAESIRSLLGFKAHLTSSWAESVCHIVNQLPSDEPSGGPRTYGPSFNSVDSSEEKNIETDEALSKIRDDLAALNAHLDQLNLWRGKALNDFLDLKGNIRVFCRIRPLLLGEKCGSSVPVVAFDSSTVLLKFAENKRKQYSFDKVFHPGSSQDEVFSEVEPVIKSALDGYNACIFAYGQTGTGKTFTMEGRVDCPGVVPRAIEALFKQALDSNHAFLFTFSMLEIYMGSLRDLLVPQSRKQTEPTMQYLIRISVTCFNAPERRRETNKIWMVDLGGSERLLKTKSRGRRLEEGKAINLSLSALGDVISALQRKKSHVPYRNSKLTQVLRDSLGEDSKTLMLVHVSPKEQDLCETVCSLGFATRVRSIHLGHEESTEVRTQKEVEMAELLQKVKLLESAREDVRSDIDKLNEKLKCLTPMNPFSIEHLEARLLSHEEPQSNIEKNKDSARTAAGPSSSQLPRFMRPTASSQQKSTSDHQLSKSARKKAPLVPARRRKASSVRAESVIFPRKMSQSEYGSDVAGSIWKYSTDCETECSQGVSECDIKTVIFPKQEKSTSSSVHSISFKGQESIHEYGNKLEDRNDIDKHLNIDNWLHLQKHEPTATNIHQSKQVLAIPKPEKKKKPDEQNHGAAANEPEALHHVSTKNVDLACEEASNHDFKEREICKQEVTDETCTSLDRVKIDVHGFDPICSSNHTVEKSELLKEIQTGPTEVSYLTDVANGMYAAINQAEQMGGIVSNVNVMRENNSIGDLCGSPPQHMEEVMRPCLHSMKSRRSLFAAKDFPMLDVVTKDCVVPANEFPDIKENRGICHRVGRTVRILYASALLGLGIQSIGLGHEFFHGLTF